MRTYTGKAEARDFAHRCLPTWPCVAPHTGKIHTLITLGIRIRIKPLVLKADKRRPCGFDSHRPLHSLPQIAYEIYLSQSSWDARN
jgi:hypothetical protein